MCDKSERERERALEKRVGENVMIQRLETASDSIWNHRRIGRNGNNNIQCGDWIGVQQMALPRARAPPLKR